MKKVLIASIVLLGVCSAYGQSTSKPTEEAKRHANKILLQTPHRVKMTVEMRETADSNWELYSSQTREVAGRDRWRTIQHTGLKLEIIGIEGRTYRKTPDGSWQMGSVGDDYTGATIRTISKPVVDSTFVGDNKAETKVIETSSQSSFQVIRTGETVHLDIKTKEWFDEAGRLTRVETEHFNFERKKFQRVTEVYEYDPNIRLEAPIP